MTRSNSYLAARRRLTESLVELAHVALTARAQRHKEWLYGQPLRLLTGFDSDQGVIVVYQDGLYTRAAPAPYLSQHSKTLKHYVKSPYKLLRNRQCGEVELQTMHNEIVSFLGALSGWQKRPHKLLTAAERAARAEALLKRDEGAELRRAQAEANAEAQTAVTWAEYFAQKLEAFKAFSREHAKSMGKDPDKEEWFWAIQPIAYLDRGADNLPILSTPTLEPRQGRYRYAWLGGQEEDAPHSYVDRKRVEGAKKFEWLELSIETDEYALEPRAAVAFKEEGLIFYPWAFECDLDLFMTAYNAVTWEPYKVEALDKDNLKPGAFRLKYKPGTIIEVNRPYNVRD